MKANGCIRFYFANTIDRHLGFISPAAAPDPGLPLRTLLSRTPPWAVLRLPAPRGPRQPIARCLVPSLPPSCLGAPRGRAPLRKGRRGRFSTGLRAPLSLPGRAAPRVPSRAGFPISLSPSGLEAPSSLPSFLGAAPWVSFLCLPAGMGHSFLLLSVSGGSAPCYLLLLPKGLGSPFHSSVSPLHITAGTLRSPVPLGMGSPLSLPVPQGMSSPRGLSHPPTQCVFFSFPEGTRASLWAELPPVRHLPPRRKRSPHPATWWSQPPLFCLLRGGGGYR